MGYSVILAQFDYGFASNKGKHPVDGYVHLRKIMMSPYHSIFGVSSILMQLPHGVSCYSSQQEKDIHIHTDSSPKRPTMGIHW